MAPASGSRLSGDRYQFLYTWYLALELLDDHSKYDKLTVEHPIQGAADDVVLESTTENYPPKGHQLKFHVDQRGSYTSDSLIEIPRASSTSLLQRLYKSWTDFPLGSEIWLVSNWSADPELGKFISGRTPVLQPNFFEGIRNAASKIRQKWSTHLGIDNDALVQFCQSLRFRLAYHSMDDLEAIVDERMRRHGLQHGPGPRAIAIDCFSQAIEEGELVFDQQRLLNFIEKSNLWSTQTLVRLVEFNANRPITAALTGTSLSANDTECCPPLREVEIAVRFLRASKSFWVYGEPGSGKSLVAYQAAKIIHDEGWNIYEAEEDWTAQGILSLVQRPALIIIDDAQRFPENEITTLLKSLSDDFSVIGTARSSKRNVKSVEISIRRSVNDVAEWMAKNQKQIEPLLSELDSRVGDTFGKTPFYERLEYAREQARTKGLWLFNYLLTGGWKRAHDILAELDNHDNASLCVFIVAVEQLASDDKGVHFQRIADIAKTEFGQDELWVEHSLACASQQKLLDDKQRLRTIHIRFAIEVLKHLTGDLDWDYWEQARKYLRNVFMRKNTPGTVTARILLMLRFNHKLHGGWLIDEPTRNVLEARLWNDFDKPEDALALIYALERWCGTTWFVDSIREHMDTLRQWLQEPSIQSARRLANVLNEMINAEVDNLADGLIENLDIPRMIEHLLNFPANEAWQVGELLDRLVTLAPNVRASIQNELSQHDLEEFTSNASVELGSLSLLLRGLAIVDHDLALDLSMKLSALFAEKLSIEPLSAWWEINKVVYWVFGYAPRFLRPNNYEPHHDAGSKVVAQIDVEQIAHQFSQATTHNQWQAMYEVLNFIGEVDHDKATNVQEKIDYTKIESSMSRFWAEPYSIRYPLASLAGNDDEPARSILERHKNDLVKFNSIMILIHPELAIRCFQDGLSLDLEAKNGLGWNGVAENIKCLGEIDPIASANIVRSNLTDIKHALHLTQSNQIEGISNFMLTLKDVCPEVIQELGQDLPIESIKEDWQQRASENPSEMLVLFEILGEQSSDELEMSCNELAEFCRKILQRT